LSADGFLRFLIRLQLLTANSDAMQWNSYRRSNFVEQGAGTDAADRPGIGLVLWMQTLRSLSECLYNLRNIGCREVFTSDVKKSSDIFSISVAFPKVRSRKTFETHPQNTDGITANSMDDITHQSHQSLLCRVTFTDHLVR
jgi:hypothetical protein